MGVQSTFENAARALRKPRPEHPLAVPPIPGTRGVWQVRRPNSVPIGYVLERSEDYQLVYHAYAHCRDSGGGRQWLRRFDTLNAAVAWMVQHERQIHAFNRRHDPEPEEWPPPIGD